LRTREVKKREENDLYKEIPEERRQELKHMVAAKLQDYAQQRHITHGCGHEEEAVDFEK
jgi:hypothetical protein